MKSSSYEESSPAADVLQRAVDLLSCMAHPVRLAVLQRLHHEGPAHVSALCDALDVEQSALSHHLRLLRAARLVVGDREGRRVVYRLHDAHVGCIIDDTLTHAAELDAAEEAR